MKNILVLCTGNSCRSQIAHGYLNYFANGNANIYGAGVETHGVNPKAIEVMKEDGINISHHTSNNINEYLDIPMDLIITVCDHAAEVCPIFPKQTTSIHHSFPDPAKATGSAEEVMNSFRSTRDLIKNYCEDFVKEHLK